MSVGETVISHPVPKEDLMVTINSDVFNDVPEASFYMGLTAVSGGIIAPSEDRGHGLFRANVYIDELGWIPKEDRCWDGTERDADDERSLRFVTLANRDRRSAVVAGVSRLMLKEDRYEEELPVEKFFPHDLRGLIKGRAAEASRFIARHPNPNIQRAIAMGNIRAMTMHAIEEDVEHVYAVVEEPLARYFGMLRMPFKRLSQPAVLPGYGNTSNLAIRFDPREIVDAANSKEAQSSPICKLFGHAALANGALGYFDQTFANRIGSVEEAA